MIRTIFYALTAAATAGLVASAASAGTLDDVKKKGFIQCGVSEGLPGFSAPDTAGNWTGLDVDFCKALAAAVLGDASKVKYSPLSAKVRFTALQSGEIDLLSRNTTWTLVRDTSLGLNFAGVMFYDGQGFMVPKKLGVKSAKELKGASVCVQIGTTTELNMADFFRANKLDYKPVVFEKADETLAAYDTGRCDAFTTDASGLAAYRIKLKDPQGHLILPELISKEPLGPVVRHGDDQWLDVNRWLIYALLEAEELGVDSKNVDEQKKSANPNTKRLLGVEGDMGKNLGLDNDWAVRPIKQVGNYAEIFDRNVGPKTTLGLERGTNALWNKGGLMYSMPIR
ncbi:MAG: amino acid ABC transporter substrate-binding protein [Rhodospirillales bacterium]|nr:amino acid ABC transporter substrate-binding protein [Rhodospirillales bacterium]